jgi:hypothetical protein
MDRGPGGRIFSGIYMLLFALALLAQPAQAGNLNLTTRAPVQAAEVDDALTSFAIGHLNETALPQLSTMRVALTAGEPRAEGDQFLVPVTLDFSAPLSALNTAGTAALNGSPVTSELYTTNDGNLRKTENGKIEQTLLFSSEARARAFVENSTNLACSASLDPVVVISKGGAFVTTNLDLDLVNCVH